MTRSPRTHRLFHPTTTGLALTLAASVALTASNAGAAVGVAAAVNQSAEGVRPGGTPTVITIGKDVIANERIDTSDIGLVQVLLNDGTTFTVGPGTSLVIDRFVYDPDRGTAEVAATITKGAFRMIGGLASKRRGGATVNTPSGSIGIRGAMLEGVVGGAQGTQFSLVFGDEARFTANNGKTTRLYEPGYTLVVGSGAQTTIRRRTAADAQGFRVALGGTAGRTGGARTSPTDAVVQQSPITQVNSGASLRVTTPVFRPVAVQSSEIETIAEEVADIAIEQRNEPRSIEEEPGIVVPLPTFRSIRVRTTPEFYQAQDGSFSRAYGNAGSRGLVGSTPASDFVVQAQQQNGRLVGTIDGISVDVPDVTGTQGDDGLSTTVLTDATINGVAATGVAYAGRGDFAAYVLFPGGDMNNPIYSITGTPADPDAINPFAFGSDIRSYSLTSDPIRPSPAAFFATDFYGQPGNFSATPFYIVEPDQSTNSEIETYYSFVDITGTGRNQRSASVVHTFSIFGNRTTNFAELNGGRRGSMRPDAVRSSFNLRGNVGTFDGPDNISIFGLDGETLVFGATSVNGTQGAYFDVAANTSEFGLTGNAAGGYADDGVFGSFHVADLTSQRSAAEFSRTSRFHQGFANGLIESQGLGGLQASYFGTGQIGLDPNEFNFTPNMFLSINAVNNSLGGNIFVGDRLNAQPFVSALDIPFGAFGGNGGGTFVDDNIFAAVDASDNARTRLFTDTGTILANDNSNPGTFVLSGRANPIPGYQHCTTCTFMDWGWWGTRVSVANDGTSGPSGADTTREYVHMGSWVAGDLTSDAQLPTFGSATYSGTAIGTVLDTSASTSAAYIATGNVNMNVDFESRAGNFAITNFDGNMSAAGALSVRDDANDFAQFDAILSGAGINGQVAGAFANDGANIARGVLGEFGLQDATRQAVGTFLGER